MPKGGAEIDLPGTLSTCPGGDCGSGHSDDSAARFPLRVETLKPADGALDGWRPPAPSGYAGGHDHGRAG